MDSVHSRATINKQTNTRTHARQRWRHIITWLSSFASLLWTISLSLSLSLKTCCYLNLLFHEHKKIHHENNDDMMMMMIALMLRPLPPQTKKEKKWSIDGLDACMWIEIIAFHCSHSNILSPIYEGNERLVVVVVVDDMSALKISRRPRHLAKGSSANDDKRQTNDIAVF